MSTNSKLALGAWLSLLAAVYATLLPFEFRPAPFAEALGHYSNLSLPQLTATGRQQWVANILLFLPLGFLWTAWLTHLCRGPAAALLVAMAVALLALLTTASVEFIQYWIPRRSPSLVDMSGNFTGAIVGIIAWHLLSRPGRIWMGKLRRGGHASFRLALLLYLVSYLFIALLPLDLLLSWHEFVAKVDSPLSGWWRAPTNHTRGIRWPLLRGLEILLTMPAGVFLALVAQRKCRHLPRAIIMAAIPALCLLFGVTLEFLQLVTVSGIAEGASVVTRAIGVVLGIALFTRGASLQPERLLPVLRPLVTLAMVPYAVLLVAVNLGSQGFRVDLTAALQQFQSLHLLPFYYHYGVAVATALQSMLLHLVMYAPIGVAARLWALGGPYRLRTPSKLVPPLAAVLVAATIEVGKLLMADLRPDPTSLLLAATAAWLAWHATDWLWRQWTDDSPVAGDDFPAMDSAATTESTAADAPEKANEDGPASKRHPVTILASAFAVTLVLLCLGLAATWPAAAPWLSIGLTSYAVMLWLRPASWLLAVPALVPVLDLSLQTGYLHFDEFDLFLILTVAIVALRWQPNSRPPVLPRWFSWALLAFALSTLISLGIGLFPPQPVDASTWAQYTNAYNGLRAAKGLFWALLLLWLLHGLQDSAETLLRQWFVPGMVLGLSAAVAIIMWERAAYPGVLDFESSYRITGLFTDMHVGGPSVETYLLMALPFGVLWAYQRRRASAALSAFALIVLTTYALAVTFSRAGYLGLGISMTMILIGVAALVLRSRDTPSVYTAGLTALSLVAGILIFAWIGSGFLERRLAQLEQDFELRLQHWRLVLQLRPDDMTQRLLGAGMGAFPTAYLWGNPERQVPSNFAFKNGEPSGSSLQLGTGGSLFINQRIGIPRQGEYTVSVDASADGGARLKLYVCEKHVRHSFGCRRGDIDVPSGSGNQKAPLVWRFSADGLKTGAWYARRQLAFSLSNATRGSVIQIDRISLRSGDGREWLRNGDFSAGGQHWYFTSDHLWPWRTENQWLEILFDQGWVGVVSFTSLLACALWLLLRRTLRGSVSDACVLASLGGALAVGLFSTIFWSPRLSMLFYLILFLGVATAHTRTEAQHPRDQAPR